MVAETEKSNELILVTELLANKRRELALCNEREPEYSRLLREQIRLEDRLAVLSKQNRGAKRNE